MGEVYAKQITAGDLIRFVEEGRIVVDHERLQRVGFAWSRSMVLDWARSLARGLAAASVIVLAEVDGRLLVVDGFQRIEATRRILREPQQLGLSPEQVREVENGFVTVLVLKGLSPGEMWWLFSRLNRASKPASYAQVLFAARVYDEAIREAYRRFVAPGVAALCDSPNGRCVADPFAAALRGIAGWLYAEEVRERGGRLVITPRRAEEIVAQIRRGAVPDEALWLRYVPSDAPRRVLAGYARNAHVVTALARLGAADALSNVSARSARAVREALLSAIALARR